MVFSCQFEIYSLLQESLRLPDFACKAAATAEAGPPIG